MENTWKTQSDKDKQTQVFSRINFSILLEPDIARRHR